VSVLMSHSPNKEHLSGYQARDYEVVDYRMYELGTERLCFRGPALGNGVSGDYFTCIGAAQTFGCFCEEPFPNLVAKALGLPALNLGYGGAGPEFFMRHGELDGFVNGGRFVIIQVMSGRSQSNSLFEARGLEYLVRRSDGAALGSDAAYDQLLFGPPALQRRPFGRVTRLLAPLFTAGRVRRIVDETRAGWIESYRRLLARITVPKVLLWYSKRTPAYSESTSSVQALFGEFPQLVNEAMVAEVRKLCDYYVECVSQRGIPQRLVSRFTGEPVGVDPAKDRPDLGAGKPWSHNSYYPSPEMHEDAAKVLIPVCERILSGGHPTKHE
jgi:Domain of unknown function (DUF6473)